MKRILSSHGKNKFDNKTINKNATLTFLAFSKFCKKVYAIDIDENKLDICKNNARVYECEDKIEYIKSDFLKVNKIKVIYLLKQADYVFLSPPWGGVKYKENDIYSIREHLIIGLTIEFKETF